MTKKAFCLTRIDSARPHFTNKHISIVRLRVYTEQLDKFQQDLLSRFSITL